MEGRIDMRKWARNGLIVLVMTGLIAYAVYHCLQFFRDPVQVTAVVRQSEMQTERMTAYLFRDEQVLTSIRGGTLQAQVEDGAHVSIQGEVARIYAGDEGEELHAKLAVLNEQISFYEQCLSAQGLSYTALPQLNEQIEQLSGRVMAAKATGDGALTRKLSDELLLLLNQKQVLTGELTDLDGQLAVLKAERAALESVYAGTYESITVDKSGYYYRRTDGYEGLFSNEALQTMTLDDFYSLIKQTPAATNTHAGKLVRDYIWYAAIPTTQDKAVMLSEGQAYPLTFADGTRLTMTLERVLSGGEGEERCVLIFKTGQMPQGFDYARIQEVTLEVGQTEGLRVPEHALLTGKDGEMGVYVLDVAYVRYRSVRVIWHGDGYVLVEECDRSVEGYETALAYQELIITRTDEELFDGKLLY